MLIKFKVKNFLSFKEETMFSMIANKDNILEDSLLKVGQIRLKKSALVFGPNGSGKSNLIKAIALVKYLVLNSKKFEKSDSFMENPFKLDSNFGEKKPIEFEIEFVKNNIIYNYFLKISTKKKGEYKFIIEQEKLVQDNNIIFNFFENNRNKSKYVSEKLKKRIEDRIDTKNKNILLLPFVREKNFDDFDLIYDWFNSDLEVLVRGYEYNIRMLDIETELEDENLKLEILKYLKKLSFSRIQNVKIEKKKRNIDKLIEKLKNEELFTDKMIEEITKEKHTKNIKLIHKNELGEDVELSLRTEESLGTNKFIELLVRVIKASKENKVLIIDEIEDSLHPALLKEIFQLINDSKNKIQLIGSTHAYPLLLYVNDKEKEIFRRDQIYFTRLLKDESTQLYSLINIGGVRLDLKIFKAYFDGRLEAFPIVEND